MRKALWVSASALASMLLIMGCGPRPVVVCGNGTCEAGEDINNCPADCSGGPVCGDGTCDAGEDMTTCPADCGGGGNCGNGVVDAGEDCDGADLGGGTCAASSEATHSALADGTLGCYAAGTVAPDGVNVGCTYDFSACQGPDITVYAAGLLSGMNIEENASPSSCEVTMGCAGGTSGRRLLHFPLVSQNIGNMDIDFGNPAGLNPPYTGLWENNGCFGNEWPDYARYWMEDAGGNIVATGLKGSFCFIENFGNAPDYPGGACMPSHNCGNMGQNVGCGDDYYIGLSCQFVDVTDVAPGQYLLCAEIDYNNKVAELNDHNNVGCTTVTIP